MNRVAQRVVQGGQGEGKKTTFMAVLIKSFLIVRNGKKG